jgi:DNA-binding response OmpR family regulator
VEAKVSRSHLSTIPVAQLIAKGLTSDQTPPATYVLVIDDEPLIADTLVQILRKAGFAAMAVYDGQSALESANVVPPQIVIADITLPGMNGIDVAIAIEESVPDAKVLLLSARAEFADLNRVRALRHEFPLVAKPVSPERLLQMVRKIAGMEINGHKKGKACNESK